MITGGLSLDTVLPGQLPEPLTALAIPANLLPHGEWPEAFAGVSCRIVNDPADAMLCRIMPEESFRVRMNFLRELSREIRRLNAHSIHLAVLSADTDRIATDPVFAEKAIALLRSIRSVLPANGMRLGLRLRLPHPSGAVAILDFLLLLQAVSGVRAVLEIHPHEPAFAAWDPAWLRPLRMLNPVTEIVYDRPLGNRMTAKLLNPLIGELQGAPHDSLLLFRPGCPDEDLLAQEAAELTALIAGWQKTETERKG